MPRIEADDDYWYATWCEYRDQEEEQEEAYTCDWHKEWEVIAAEAAAAEAAAFAALKERVGIELPDTYIPSSASLPIISPTHPWCAQILYMRERLHILNGIGLDGEVRVKLIGDIFTYLVLPENVGLLHSNATFREVVRAKITEFRADARATSIMSVMDTLASIIAHQ